MYGRKVLSLLACLLVAGTFFVSSASAAGKQLITTDQITAESKGAYYMKGYISDTVITESGNVIGLFCSENSAKKIRFFMEYATSGQFRESLNVIIMNNDTNRKSVMEGRVISIEGRLIFRVFGVAPDFG